MPRKRNPRRGSLGFERKRASRITPSINWFQEDEKGEAKIIGFAGWKAGMTRVQYTDTRAQSATKGKRITKPVTVIDCPDIFIAGVRYYKNSDILGVEWDDDLPDFISKKIKNLNSSKNIDKENVDNVRLFAFSQPDKSGMHKNKPDLFEIAMSGDVGNKIKKAKELLGKEIKVEDVFEKGSFVDVAGITKGKGFQGVVKRFHVKVKMRKAEKSHRHVGSIGGVVPQRILWQTPQAGQLGFFNRTELNKKLLDFGKGEEVTPKSGFKNYGVVPEKYLLIEGSVPAPKKRLIILRKAARKKKKIPVELDYISKDNQ